MRKDMDGTTSLRFMPGICLLLAFVIAAPSGAQAYKYKLPYDSICCHASGTLVMDSAGNLYGATLQSPFKDNGGVAFALLKRPKGGWKYKELYTFCHEPLCT